jgi:phosphoribosylformylglycinamidine synthase
MAEACRALGLPVIGGNVSLYNESRGRDIDPTPVVATLGLVDRLERRPPGVGLVEGSRVVLLGGRPESDGEFGGSVGGSLGGSRWAAEVRGHRGGALAPLDLDLHGRLVALVAGLVSGDPVAGGDPVVDGIHDVSDGGIGLALAEMAVRSGVGARVSGIADHAALFGEGPSRVLVSVPVARLAELTDRAEAAGVGWLDLGSAGGDRLVVEGLVDVRVGDAVNAWRGVLPGALGVS